MLKINLVDFKVEALNQKIDNVRDELGEKIDCVAADLAAHRRDTEAHPAICKVKEGNWQCIIEEVISLAS